MTNNISPSFQEWLKERLKKEFQPVIRISLEKNEETSEIAKKIIHSKKMSDLLNSMRISLHSQGDTSNFQTYDSRSQSPFSYVSEVLSDEWNSPRSNDEEQDVIEQISRDQTVHVRLAGYEILMKSELTALRSSPTWNDLKETLMDGLIDESRPIFEASLQVHTKLLNYPQWDDVYINLMNAFNAQYNLKKSFEMLPTLVSGINFKLFIHERLIRIAHLIIQHQSEILKTIRNIDKSTEEITEQFIRFMSSNEFGTATQLNTLNILNIISVLEPRADWCKKWMISFGTRRIFLAALAKSPNLLQRIIKCVEESLKDEASYSLTLSIYDELNEVCINGSSVETITYLHCLCFVSQLCAYQAGRTLLSEVTSKEPFSVPTFVVRLVKTLTKLSSESSCGTYDICRYALRTLLDKPKIIYDDEFYHAALCHLLNNPNNNTKIDLHILDIMFYMLDSEDGTSFLISECKSHSNSQENDRPTCPAVILIISMSNMLKQPYSIISVEYLVGMFTITEKLLDTLDSYEIIQHYIEKDFYPAVKHFHDRLSKCSFENENKAQHINSALRKLLTKISSIPLGFQSIVHEQLIFKDLLRESITPLRSAWTSRQTISFVTIAAFFEVGYNTLVDPAFHVLSMLLTDTCKSLEDPLNFSDLLDNESVKKLLHVLTFFSLNFKCFTAFMVDTNPDFSPDEDEYPQDLKQLFNQFINPDAKFYDLGLASLRAVIWNLNISIYFLKELDFQSALWQAQQQPDNNIETEDDVDVKKGIDNYNMLRQQILGQLCFNKRVTPENTSENAENDETDYLANFDKESISNSDNFCDPELENLLQENKSGLLDNDWVTQVRETYEATDGPLNNTMIIHLVDQMQKATPTAEWVESFQWPEKTHFSADFWFVEDMKGIDLAMQYAEQNEIIHNTGDLEPKLQEFINASYIFIQYEKPTKFEGFDWFLSTVFFICNGDISKCKTFLSQIIHFPSTIFLWSSLGKVIDRVNEEECATQITFMQLVECIVSNELSHIKFALKTTCGVDWSLICNLLVSQCFWGTLPWSEILRFIAISVLYSPDYVIYYCVSLLYHCQNTLMQHVTNGKLWPENMDLQNYQSHKYMTYMDILAKRYGNKVLPKIAVKETQSTLET